MAWGGSLNREGTKYLQIVRASDRAVEYLEELKKYLDSEDDKKQINITIDIIAKHVEKITEAKIEDL